MTAILPARRRSAIHVLLVILVSLLINLVLFVSVARNNPEYLLDYRLNDNPDAVQYVQLGENLWSRGVYSRQPSPPYAPDILRTPVYPVVAGAVESAFGVIWPLYLLQIALSTLTAALVYIVGARLFGRTAGLSGALLCAFDPMLAVLNLEAMSEPLYLLLVSLGTLLWAKQLAEADDRPGGRILTGVIVGLAILTRPSGFYLPIALGILELLIRLTPGRRFHLRGALTVVLASYLTVAPWIVRNYALFQLPRLTTADTINLLYFAGAGVYQVRDGIDRETAQARIAADFRLPTLVESNNPWVSGLDIASTDASERRAARTILLGNPGALLRSSANGVLRAFLAHNAGLLARMMGGQWTGGNLDRICTGDFAAARRSVGESGTLAVAVMISELGIVALEVALSIVGLILVCRRPGVSEAGLMIGGAIAYHVLTILIVGPDAYSRHRAPAVPLLCLLGGFAVSRFREWSGRNDHPDRAAMHGGQPSA